MSSDDVILSVKNISKRFEMYEKPAHRLFQFLCAGKKQFYKEFWALKNISFDVHRGECIGVIGKNGAGKSTLLQLLVGTLNPTSGKVDLKGRVAALLELGSGFNPEFTGKENVYMNAAILGLTKEETDLKFQEIVDFADIGEFIDQPVKTYSSGMMVRLAFSVQVMVEPDILIVDEALAVGDAFFQRKCYAKMEAMIQKGMTLFLVTHNTEIVKRICKKAIYIKNGEMVDFGDSVEIVAQYFKDLFPGAKQPSTQCLDEEGLSILSSEGLPMVRTKPNSGLNKMKKIPLPADETSSKGYCYEWRNNEEKSTYSYGAGGGEITAVRVYGVEKPNILPEAGWIHIEIDAHWDQSTIIELIAQEQLPKNIYLGFGVSNAQNIRLFGGNTHSSGLKINPMETDHITAIFKVEFPKLQAGDYFIVTALSLGTIDSATQLNWNDFSIHLISTNTVTGGFFAPKTLVIVEKN